MSGKNNKRVSGSGLYIFHVEPLTHFPAMLLQERATMR